MRLSPAEEALLKQVRTLPPDLIPLVSGLVEFLVKTEQERRQREVREADARDRAEQERRQHEQRETEQRRQREQREAEERRADQAQLEGGPLGRVWDNADDAAYDRL